jgi:hypothetical protein
MSQNGGTENKRKDISSEALIVKEIPKGSAAASGCESDRSGGGSGAGVCIMRIMVDAMQED